MTGNSLCPILIRRGNTIVFTVAPNGFVPQNICSSGNFLLAGRFGKNNMSLKGEIVAGKYTIQGV